MIKRLLKIAGWTVGLIAVFAIAVIALNAFDESLSPEASALVAERKPSLKDEENAFYAIWGFTAADGADPHAVGRRIVALLKEKYPASSQAADGKLYDGEIGKLNTSPELRKLCNWRQEDCYEKFVAASDRAAALATENKVLLERYAALSAYKGVEYAGPITLMAPTPAMGNVTDMATLELLNAVADAKRGDAASGLKRFELGIAFWRSVLGTSGNYGQSKRGAATLLHRHLMILARIAGDHPEFTANKTEEIEKWLAPLSVSERSMAGVIQSDFQVMHNFFVSARRDMNSLRIVGEASSDPAGWLKMLFIQPNATSNLIAKSYVEGQRVALLPADKFLAELPAYRDSTYGERFSDDFSLRNLEGRRLIAEFGPTTFDYELLRLHDLDQHLRLVALQIELLGKKPEAGAVAALVSGAGPEHRDPYTGKPFEWLESKRELRGFPHYKPRIYGRGPGGIFLYKI